MTVEPISNIPDYSHWRNAYSAETERWKDLRRTGVIIVPIVILLFLATMAAIVFVVFRAADWGANVKNIFGFYWYEFRITITYLSPLLVALTGILLLYRAVIDYVKKFYSHPEQEKLFSLIQRRLLGKLPLPPPLDTTARYPFIVVKEPQEFKEDHWARWLGGPATLVIYDGLAFYLERGGRFSRVVGPGSPPMPFLERHETVKTVVDLRPQVKTGQMKPWTKDGIQLELDIRMECQVNASEKALAESKNLVYPFDPIAVKEAAEYTAVKRDLKTGQLFESDWLDGIWGKVTGYLARHISCHSVDEIALTEIKDIGMSEGNLQTFQLAKDHLEKMNADLSAIKCGVHVTNIHLLIKFPKDVEEKRVAYWQSERKKLTIIRESKAQADGIRIALEARAKAERDVLDAITERLKRAGKDNYTEALLLSLTGILDSSLDDPLVRPMIAKQSIDLLEKLKSILDRRF
jgi:hypothetical protein